MLICPQCNFSTDLTVHHDVEKFSDILAKSVSEAGDSGESFEIKTNVAEWVAQYHEKNEVSGVVLFIECHRREHFGL